MGIKAVDGGLLVVLFALIGEAARPKRFAGLFATAPSIALANLGVIAVVKGAADAQQQSAGMVVGAAALLASCAVGIVAVARWDALRGALGVVVAWLGIAAAGGLLVWR